MARAVIEENFEGIKVAFSKALKKGSPYAFQVLSDRAYGKLKETHAIEHNPYKPLSDEELEAKIKELEQRLAKELGYIRPSRRYCHLRWTIPRSSRYFEYYYSGC